MASQDRRPAGFIAGEAQDLRHVTGAAAHLG